MQLNRRFHFGSKGSDLRVRPFFLLFCEERRDRENRDKWDEWDEWDR